MSGKVDIAKLASRARAAEQDEWRWNAGVLEGVHNGQVLLFANLDARETDEPEIIVSWTNRVHIEANSPPVTLALLAYIDRLESIVRMVASRFNDAGEVAQADLIYSILDNGAVLE